MQTLTQKNKNLTSKELEHIEARIQYSKNGCWLMSGYKDKDGYCQLGFRRKIRRAHRVVWYAVNGVIGDEWLLDHTCRTRNCVNPFHLRKVTSQQNTVENSKSIAAFNAKKTHCLKGHPYDRKYGGQRYCSICQAEKTKRLRKKWKEHPLLEGV